MTPQNESFPYDSETLSPEVRIEEPADWNTRISALYDKAQLSEIDKEGFVYSFLTDEINRMHAQHHENGDRACTYGIRLHSKEQDLFYPQEKDPEDDFSLGSDVILEVKDLEEFTQEYLLLIQTAKENLSTTWVSEPNLDRKGNELTEEQILKRVISMAWASATPEDFANPIQHIRRIASFMRDVTFEQNEPDILSEELPTLGGVIEIRKAEDEAVFETPNRLEIRMQIKDEAATDAGLLPYVRFGIDSEQESPVAYVYALQQQNFKEGDISPEDEVKRKKLNRKLYKLNKGVFEQEDEEFREYARQRQAEEITGESYYPENISDVSPAAVMSLAVALSTFKQKGITRIKFPDFEPLRWQDHSIKSEDRHGDSEEADRIQQNTTDKFLRTVRRVAAQIKGVNIIHDVDQGGSFMLVKLDEDSWSSDNELMQEVLTALNGIE